MIKKIIAFFKQTKSRILTSYVMMLFLFTAIQFYLGDVHFIIQLILSLIFIITFVYLGNIYLERTIFSKIRQVIHFSRLVKDKNLSQKIEFKSKDPLFTDLGASLNDMVVNLRVVLEENLASAEQLAFAASEMSTMAEEANCATEEITSIMDQMGNVTEEQFTNVHLSMLASQQMSETAQQVAVEAQKAANFSSQAAQRARGGEEVIQLINTKMIQVKETVDNSADVVRRLGSRSLEIGKIVDVIRGISRQTNLLALNAAIEAARAGEHGRGFSVVADEVRALAEQSTRSAIQIVSLINEIQNETQAAIEAIETGTRVVDEGTELASSASDAFTEITRSVNQTVNTIHEIAAASEEQAASSEEMSSTMQSVAATSKQNVSSAKHVGTATLDQRMTMEKLAESAAQLVLMADELTSMVGRFKVKSNFQRCWRVRDCNFVNCPAYQSKEEKCWLIPETLGCDGVSRGSVMDKRQECHQCEVFKLNTKVDY